MIAAIALGANLPSRWGAPPKTLQEALRKLGELGEVMAVSSFHDTEPVGLREQPPFTNAAALLQTRLGAVEFMRALLEVETSMGRVRTLDLPPKGPRVLDLDLLLYVDDAGRSLILDTPQLTLPHPALHERRFALQPLVEIAPTLIHPLFHRSMRELLDALP